MRSVIRLAGIMTGVALAGAVITAAAPAMAASAANVTVPCDTDALATAITNANGAGGGTITLTAGCTYSIVTPASATDGLPVITGNINIVGAQGTTITRSAVALFRILEVAASGNLHLSNVIITNGNTAGLGGGILNSGGTLLLNGVSLQGNTGSNGGAVSNSGTGNAQIFNSTLRSNTTTSVGGGGIMNFGTLTLSGSTVSKNHAPINGGGLNTQPGGVSDISATSFLQNTATSLGGGISNLGTTRLTGSTVQHNTGSAGGGIATGNNNVTLINTIVTLNTPDNCSPPNTIPGCVN
jgi:predicted outer membrane repeat protein